VNWNLSDPTQLILLRVLGATAAAGLGALLGLPARRASHRMLCGMVSFAAGGLLAVTATHIVPESMELISTGGGIAATLFGLALFYAIGRYVYSLCPACSATDSEKGFFQLSILMMVSMGLHSLTDGLAIVAGSKLGGAVGTQIGFLIFLAVSYHKVPEGLALMTVVRGAGHSTPKAFGITLLIELITGLGAVAGLLFLTLTSFQLGLLLGVVAGSFLYIVFFAILKEMWQHERGSIFLFTGLGIASILLMEALLPMAHLH
jgi:zinc transporter, ZIP family